MDYPDKDGKYEGYGGKFIPEALMEPLTDLEETYLKLKDNPDFKSELDSLFKNYVGRPTALSFCERLSKKYGAKIYLKREDLAHTGAHKINNALGQGLIAKKMGKTRMIAETGAGQHGVATATAGAKLGLETEIYMGTVDMERQSLNVFRMELLGSKVIPVKSGSNTLKDAINEAFRDWVSSFPTTHYLFGSVLGPHPYPMIVRDFQSIIGREIKQQIMELEGRLPDHIVACVGGGSNAMGAWYAFLEDEEVDLVGVEAGGRGIKSGEHAARFADSENGRKGVFQGSYSFVLQDRYGQINNTHSISAGLDYSAIGPEHSMLRDMKRARYAYATDDEVLDAVKELCQEEGILPALESAHAVAHGLKMAKDADMDEIIVINLSGRGDKDVHTLIEHTK